MFLADKLHEIATSGPTSQLHGVWSTYRSACFALLLCFLLNRRFSAALNFPVPFANGWVWPFAGSAIAAAVSATIFTDCNAKEADATAVRPLSKRSRVARETENRRAVHLLWLTISISLNRHREVANVNVIRWS